MDKDKMLKLLKSGNWEDALIAFHLMKNWTIEDVSRVFITELHGIFNNINLGSSTHIKTVKINENLYAGSGGIYSLWFSPNISNIGDFIEI